MRKITRIIFSGQRFGRLIVIEETFRYRGKQRIRFAKCQCDCGNEYTGDINGLLRGDTVSCGCKAKETVRNRGKLGNSNRRHNETINNKPTKLYRTWSCMKTRTTYPKHEHYKYYGGRGIGICEEWKIAANFFKWAKENGYREGLQLDRIDNDGNYEPSNCRFVTRSVNCLNRRKRPNYAIYFRSGRYCVTLTRGRDFYYGGSAKTLAEAKKIREIFLIKLDSILNPKL